MNRFLKSALSGVMFGLAAASTIAVLAVTFTGRDTTLQRTIQQVGMAAVTPEVGITATPSGTQVTSYQLSAGVSQVTTVATIGDGVKLMSLTQLGPPTNLDASLNAVVINNAGNSMNLFPFAATDVIVSNGVVGGAGAALAVGAGKSADCWSISGSGRWYCTVG